MPSARLTVCLTPRAIEKATSQVAFLLMLQRG
jgi:hypothetical protein